MRFHCATMAVAVGLALAALPTRAAAQLPEGPGRETVTKLCGSCHPPERGASVRLTREGWQDVMVRMAGLGMKGTDEELTAALEYLAAHFKGEAAAPLNLNKATPIQLQPRGTRCMSPHSTSIAAAPAATSSRKGHPPR